MKSPSTKNKNRINLQAAKVVLKEMEFKKTDSDIFEMMLDEESGSLIIKPKNEIKSQKEVKQVS